MLDFPSGITYFYNSGQHAAVSFQLKPRRQMQLGNKKGASVIKQTS